MRQRFGECKPSIRGDLVFKESVNFCFDIGCVAVDGSVAQESVDGVISECLLSFNDAEFAFDLVGEFGSSGEVGVVEDGGVSFRGQLLSLMASLQGFQAL